MRQITITGRLAADAEVKMTKQNNQYITFRMANSEFGDDKDRTYWFRVTSFETRHSSMAKYLTKGKPVIVTGRYEDGIYQTNSGKSEINREIVAYNIEFMSVGKESEGGTTQNNTNTSTTSEKTKNNSSPSFPTMNVPTETNDTTNVKEDESDDLPF